MTKRRSYLQALFVSVECKSFPTGTFLVLPKWREPRPGVITRIYAAGKLWDFLNAHLKKAKP